MVKNLPDNTGKARDADSIPECGRPLGIGGLISKPLQCSCLENPMDGGAWWTADHGGHWESDTTEAMQQQQQIAYSKAET